MVNVEDSEKLQNYKKCGSEDLDALFEKAGGFGLYQILLAISKQWMTLHLSCVAIVFYAFGSIPPELKCHDPNWSQTVSPNLSPEEMMCAIRANCSNYSVSRLEFHSFVYEFDLLCKDREPLYRNMVTVCAGVHTVWGLLLGHLADHVGRKWIFLMSHCISLVGLYLASLAVNYHMLFVSVIGMGCLEYSIAYVFFSELVTKSYRSVMGVASQWSIAYAINALIGYWTNDWRLYLQTVAIISTPLAVISCFGLVESPRWLIQKKKYKRAEKSLKLIAKINRVPPPNLFDIQEFVSCEKQKYPYNLLHLFSSKSIAIRTILQSSHIAINVMAGQIILYDIHTLEGSTFVNIAIHGLLRIWVPFVVVALDWKAPKCGRKCWILTSIGIITMSYVASFIIFLENAQEHLKMMHTVFAQIAALTVASIFSIAVQLYNVELFPTVLRNIANSFTLTVGSIVAMIVPQILFLRNYWRPLPFFIVIILCVITFVLDIFFLPETHGEPLIESLNDSKDGLDTKDRPITGSLSGTKRNLK